MRILVLLGVVSAFLATHPALSQTTVDPNKAALKAAFEETLKKPADPATLLRYAEAAVQAGDLEAAISALERLLLLDGDQPKVKLELGVLYYRLGSYEASRSYLEGARTSGRATEEVKQRAAGFIAQIDSKTAKSSFSGDLFVALRYSNNANTGPGGPISSGGALTVPDPTVSSRPDMSALSVLSLRHRYDLGRQDNGALESDLVVYGTRQFQVSEVNLLYIDFFIGPRTEPFDGWLDDMSVKPFFTGRYVAEHDLTTYWAWGTGIELTGPLTNHIRAAYTLLGRRRDFINNADSAINDRSSGNEFTNVLDFRVELTPYMTMALGGSFTRFIAQVASESYVEYGFNGSMTVRFTDPIGINGRVWSIVGSLGMTFADYDQPDLSIDPTTRRRQTDTNLGLVLAVPLDAQLTVSAQAQYTNRQASVTNYAYDAFTAMLGVGWRF